MKILSVGNYNYQVQSQNNRIQKVNNYQMAFSRSKVKILEEIVENVTTGKLKFDSCDKNVPLYIFVGPEDMPRLHYCSDKLRPFFDVKTKDPGYIAGFSQILKESGLEAPFDLAVAAIEKLIPAS